MAKALLKWASLEMGKALNQKWKSVVAGKPPGVDDRVLPQCLWVSVPPPHEREAWIKTVVYATGRKAPVALVLPQASYADGRWDLLFKRLTLVNKVPPHVHIYQFNLNVSHDLWASQLTLHRKPPGTWLMWRVL